VVAYRFEANLFYANAGFFMDELLRLVSNTKQPVRAVVLDTTGIDDIDYSAAKMLVQLRRALQRRGISMAVIVSYHVVLEVLTRFGVVDDRDEWYVHHSLDTAIAALQRSGITAASTS
jgi:MFS superfamily sulfate permease-like transporter